MFTPHTPQTAEKQPALPGIITGEPVECPANELPATLERIRLAGFHVLQMHVITQPRQGYRLTLTRCGCDLCRDQPEREQAAEQMNAAGAKHRDEPKCTQSKLP